MKLTVSYPADQDDGSPVTVTPVPTPGQPRTMVTLKPGESAEIEVGPDASWRIDHGGV